MNYPENYSAIELAFFLRQYLDMHVKEEKAECFVSIALCNKSTCKNENCDASLKYVTLNFYSKSHLVTAIDFFPDNNGIKLAVFTRKENELCQMSMGKRKLDASVNTELQRIGLSAYTRSLTGFKRSERPYVNNGKSGLKFLEEEVMPDVIKIISSL